MKTLNKRQTLLHSGRVRTLESDDTWHEAILIEDDRITGIGSTDELEAAASRSTERVHLGGKTILPGLCDAHLHFEKYALAQNLVDCETATLEACLHRIRSRADETPAGEWILGHGWNQNVWDRFGNAQDLDEAAPTHPVYLTAKSLHAGWANSHALRVCGIDEHTPNPEGGTIQKDAGGFPTGILFEAGMDLVSEKIPPPSLEELGTAMLSAQEVLWRMGLTALHDFDGSRCFRALQLLHEESRLGLRVLKNILADDLEHALALGLQSGFGDEWLRIGNVKFFADGALGPQTAAMLEPYADEPENHGILLLDQEQLFEAGARCVANGLAIAVHAIGDRANHEVLQAFERLREYEYAQNLPAFRHRMEHLQVMHPDDLQRPAELGVLASMQPVHAVSDMDAANHYWEDRVRFAYAWRNQLDAGATLAFGSDAPVESPNPFLGLHAAVSRRRRDGSPGKEGWIPGQRISLLEALHGYTRGAAYAAGMETTTGKLAPGYLADLIVLEMDPFKLDTLELAQLSPVGTLVAGEWRYRAFD